MSDLNQLQENFQNYLMQHNPFIENEIISTEKVAATTRLDIYRDAYYLRLLESLDNDYPVLHVLMGDEQFEAMGRQFIDAYPSTFRSLRWYSHAMADFLQVTAPYSKHGLFSEMARFEWLTAQAFDAEDSDVIGLEDMGAIPYDQWAEMRFTLHPAFCRSHFQWNIVPMWTAVKEDETPEPQMSDEKVEWMFWRNGLDVQFCSLSVDEAYMVDAMHAGGNFGEICEGLCEWIEPEQVAMHAATLLKRFIIDGLVVTVSV